MSTPSVEFAAEPGRSFTAGVQVLQPDGTTARDLRGKSFYIGLGDPALGTVEVEPYAWALDAENGIICLSIPYVLFEEHQGENIVGDLIIYDEESGDQDIACAIKVKIGTR